MSDRANILVVDDDAGIRQMIQLALTEAGHDVRIATGREPVGVADADLVILDIRLGHRSAHELVAQQPELFDRPVILMTATSSTEDALRGLPPPVTVLRKPFDLDALDAAVASALGRTSGSVTAPGAAAG